MQNLYDYKKFAILYVDDEEKSLKYFKRAFEDQFWIFTAVNGQEGLKLLEEHKEDIGLLMTDQRMPGEKGVWLLEKARLQTVLAAPALIADEERAAIFQPAIEVNHRNAPAALLADDAVAGLENDTARLDQRSFRLANLVHA